MNREELGVFWDYRLIKIWVVRLSDRRGQHTERLIVRSRTGDGAIRVAKANSYKFRTNAYSCTARYAHPVNDLKCTPSTGEFVRPPLYELTEAGIKHYYPHVLTNA